MTINVEVEYQDATKQLPFDFEVLAGQVVEAVLDQEGCPYEAQVELTLTDEASIRQINMQQRGINRATDVLSFPMVEYEKPAKYDILEQEASIDCFDPDSGELLLGDIVLSVPRVLDQAQEYGHSIKREYAFLIAHSMLHLLGYDHMEPEEAKKMEARQKMVMDTLQILRTEAE